MSLPAQRLHIVELKEAKKLKDGERRVINSLCYLAGIVGATFVMLAVVFTR